MSDLAPILIILVGGFSLLGGLLEWSWLMNHPQARLISRAVGRTGTRIFYVLAGLIAIGIGVAIWIAGT